VNYDWMRQKLQDFLTFCQQYEAASGPAGEYNRATMKPIADMIDDRVPTVQRIIGQLDPSLLPEGFGTAWHMGGLSETTKATRRALAIVRDREQWEANLAPDSPSLVADELHPNILEPEYDVCLSFAGEQRPYVSEVAAALLSFGIRVFYDEYEKAALWGRDLYEHLDWVYRKAARYCLVFISSDYAAKVWTTHERRSAQARALQESREYVLPVRFDDTELPGLPPTVGYVSANQLTAEELASLTMQKLGLIRDEVQDLAATARRSAAASRRTAEGVDHLGAVIRAQRAGDGESKVSDSYRNLIAELSGTTQAELAVQLRVVKVVQELRYLAYERGGIPPGRSRADAKPSAIVFEVAGELDAVMQDSLDQSALDDTDAKPDPAAAARLESLMEAQPWVAVQYVPTLEVETVRQAISDNFQAITILIVGLDGSAIAAWVAVGRADPITLPSPLEIDQDWPLERVVREALKGAFPRLSSP
jgi:hypothetical protein